MEEDDDDHQESLGGEAQLVSVGDVLLIQPSKLLAKKVLLEEHSGSGLELRLQWRRWMRELVKSWRRCKMSQMPFEPPRLRSQVIKASHQSMRASQITST